MSQFSFPILENEELLPCLEEMEVQLDAAALNKPSYEVVRPVFEQIVIMLTGVTREELTQPMFTAMDAFEYPELHDESIAANNLFRQLGKLMSASGVKDFSWRDVFKPEPVRLRRHLSAIINFAKFREEKALAFQELQSQLDQLVADTRAVEEKHSMDMHELKRLQAKLAAQVPEVQRVEAEEVEIVARNTALNKQATALQNEVRGLKALVNNLADAASQAKLDLAAAKQETVVLLDQVVQSPDKQRQAIADLASAAEAQRAYCAQLNSQCITNDRRLEMVTKTEKEVVRCLKLMDELDSVVARKKDVSQQVKDMKESITANDRAMSDLNTTGASLRQHQATLMDKFQRIESQAALKMEAAAGYVEEAMRSKAAVEAEAAAIAAKAAEDEAAIRSLREHMQEIAIHHETSTRSAMEKYAVLRKAVGDYNQRLMHAMSDTRHSLDQGFQYGNLICCLLHCPVRKIVAM